MKVGIRKPSLKKSIKARTTGKAKRALKKAINPAYGKKGMGIINNPKKAVYNKVYNRTTIGINDVVKNSSNKSKSTTNSNVQLSDKKIYKVINKNEVVIGNNHYSNKSIKLFKNIFMFFAILFLIIGIISLPIGIMFLLFSLFMYSMAKTYKGIYNEMLNFKEMNDNELE